MFYRKHMDNPNNHNPNKIDFNKIDFSKNEKYEYITYINKKVDYKILENIEKYNNYKIYNENIKLTHEKMLKRIRKSLIENFVGVSLILQQILSQNEILYLYDHPKLDNISTLILDKLVRKLNKLRNGNIRIVDHLRQPAQQPRDHVPQNPQPPPIQQAIRVPFNNANELQQVPRPQAQMAIPKLIIEGPKPMDLSDDPVQKDQDEDDKLCCVCMELPKNTLLMPCKHLCVCSTCNVNTCPLCRTVITNKIDGIFM